MYSLPQDSTPSPVSEQPLSREGYVTPSTNPPATTPAPSPAVRPAPNQSSSSVIMLYGLAVIVFGLIILLFALFGKKTEVQNNKPAQDAFSVSSDVPSLERPLQENTNVAAPLTFTPTPVSATPQERINFNNDMYALSSFPEAKDTWKPKLGITSLPKDSFVEVIFDKTKAAAVASVQKKVTKPTMADFDWQNPRSVGVSSVDNLAVFWGTTITVPTEAMYSLTVSDSHSNTRVIIDNRVVHDGVNGVSDKNILLSTGNHSVEIEYINKWHVPSFVFSLKTVSEIRAQTSVKTVDVIPQGSSVHVVGVYEGKKGDIVVNSPAKKIQGYLVLKSYEDVNWILKGDFSGLSGILVDSVLPGAAVQSVPQGVSVVHSQDKLPIFYTMKSSCYVASGAVRCNTSSEASPAFFDAMKSNNWNLVSFTGDYSPESLQMSEYTFSGADDAKAKAAELLAAEKHRLGF